MRKANQQWRVREYPNVVSKARQPWQVTKPTSACNNNGKAGRRSKRRYKRVAAPGKNNCSSNNGEVVNAKVQAVQYNVATRSVFHVVKTVKRGNARKCEVPNGIACWHGARKSRWQRQRQAATRSKRPPVCLRRQKCGSINERGWWQW